MFPAGAAAMFPGQQPVFSPSSPALTAAFSCPGCGAAQRKARIRRDGPNSSGKLGLLPPPRAPGLPGSRLILRKSGRRDLRWGEGWGGGSSCCVRCVRQLLPPPPTPPQPAAGLPASGKYKADQPRRAGVGWGGEHTEYAAILLVFWPKPNGLRPAPPSNVPLTPSRRPGTLRPCHPCEITGNLGLRVERSRPHRLYV